MRDDTSTRFYELMVISVPDGEPEELIATVENVAGYVEEAGGQVLRKNSDSPWGRRRLAYPIRHQGQDVRDGFYTLYHFEIQPNLIGEFEREMKLNERLMRYLLLQLEEMPTFPEPEEDSEESEGEASSTEEGAQAPAAETPPSASEAEGETSATSQETASADTPPAEAAPDVEEEKSEESTEPASASSGSDGDGEEQPA